MFQCTRHVACLPLPLPPLFSFFQWGQHSRTVTNFLAQWEYLKLHLTVIIIRPWNVTHILSHICKSHSWRYIWNILVVLKSFVTYMDFNRLIWKFDLWYLKEKIVPNFHIDFFEQPPTAECWNADYNWTFYWWFSFLIINILFCNGIRGQLNVDRV